MRAEWLTAVIAIAALVLAVTLRSASNGKIEITLNDAIIAAIAAGLALLVSGKIAKLGIGNEGLTIETAKEAILSSAKRPIAQQITQLPVLQLPVVPVEEVMKGGVAEIPNILRRKAQGLDFALGLGIYDPGVLKIYLETLTRYDFFRYVILMRRDGALFGMLNARTLQAALSDGGSGETYADFESQLNRATAADLERIAQLPGFVPAGDAVGKQADKREVLARMQKSGRDWLPVVGENGRFDGIVDQSRLIASMILDVTDQLRTTPPTQ
jgi:hypothetical protein